MKGIATLVLGMALALSSSALFAQTDTSMSQTLRGIEDAPFSRVDLEELDEKEPDASFQDTVLVTEPGHIILPVDVKPDDFGNRYFGGVSGHRARVLFNVRGANSGLTFAVQLTDLYWEYEAGTFCYNDVWATKSCGTSNGWTNTVCTNTTSGGGSIPPSISTTGSYSKSGDSFTITYSGNVTSGIRLTLGPTSISSGTLPEPLLINYQVLNWVLY